MKNDNTIQLGNLVRDVVTGFKGIAVSRLESIDGTTDYGIRASAKKDEPSRPDPIYICSNQLEKIDDGVLIKPNIKRLGFRNDQ